MFCASVTRREFSAFRHTVGVARKNKGFVCAIRSGIVSSKETIFITGFSVLVLHKFSTVFTVNLKCVFAL
jgi:hypothetical protein